MGDLVKSVFGGTDKSAQGLQMRRNVDLQHKISKLSKEGREELMALLPDMQRMLQEGGQAGVDVLAGALPQQTGAITQGSVGGQAQLLAGLPQIQNAILGRPVDFNVLQPTAVTPDLSFAQQQVPNLSMSSAADALGGMAAAAPPQQAQAAGGLSPENFALAQRLYGSGRRMRD